MKKVVGYIRCSTNKQVVDGDTLRNEAVAEKEFLMTQLREMLEQTSRKALLEADSEEATRLQEKLGKVPTPIFIG